MFCRLWKTVVRTTSPFALHRRLEGSHPSLRIPAVVRDLSEENNACDTWCSPLSLFLILARVWTVHV